MLIALIITAILLTISYATLLSLFIAGWRKNSLHFEEQQPSKLWVSVVVAVRNEEKNILSLLKCLQAQDYPASLYEVIISDDGSCDDTPAKVAEFIAQKENFHLITKGPSEKPGKKGALDRATACARGSIIVTTDADCSMGSRWLSSLTSPFADEATRLVIGPVTIDDNSRRLFSMMQTLEFMSLTGATGGAAGIKKPVMCNGANLAFRKTSKEKVLNLIAGQQFASGDDVFLMHAIHKKYPDGVRFLKNKSAIVNTLPADTPGEFFSQRVRWAGKSAGYNDGFTLCTGGVVAGMNVFVVLLAILAMLLPSFAPVLVYLFPAKLMADVLVIIPVANFLSRRKLLLLYPFVALIYPFYVTTTLVLAWLGQNKWKQRTL